MLGVDCTTSPPASSPALFRPEEEHLEGGPCVWEALEADGGGRGRGTYTETERKLGRAQDLSTGA